MRLAILLLALLSADPAVNARLLELDQARARLTAEQGALGKLPDDASRLRKIYKIDQDSLDAYPDVDGLSDAQVVEVNRAYKALTRDINAANVTLIKRMLPAAGWFSSKVYGQEAATGAYLVIQHSDNPPLQKRFLPVMERMVASGEALGSEYALVYDRIAVGEGRLQRYGSQMHCVDGRMVPQPMEDPSRIEERRAPMGFRWPTYQDYLANFGACPRAMLNAP
jgi:hypothetical protein